MIRATHTRHRGFTLIELIVVIAMAAILLGIATSNFSSFISMMRVRNAAFDLVADLNLARSEAVKRNATVTVQAQSNGDWTTGWTLTTVDPTNAANTLTLINRGALGGALVITNAPTALVYDAGGRASALNAALKFQICPPTGQAVQGRLIRVDPSGQSRSTTTTACT